MNLCRRCGVCLERVSGANGCLASYYWEAAARRKKKNKKGCFHSPFFYDERMCLK